MPGVYPESGSVWEKILLDVWENGAHSNHSNESRIGEEEMATLNRQLHNSKSHKQGNDPACPVCQRFKQFSELIEEIGARHITDVKGPLDSELSFYVVAGKTFIVQWFGRDHVDGFDIYGVLTTSTKTLETFDALRSYASRSIFECDKPIMVESPAGSGKYREV